MVLNQCLVHRSGILPIYNFFSSNEIPTLLADPGDVWDENAALPLFKCILSLSSRPLTRILNRELPSLSVKELSLCSENIAKLELVAAEG